MIRGKPRSSSNRSQSSSGPGTAALLAPSKNEYGRRKGQDPGEYLGEIREEDRSSSREKHDGRGVFALGRGNVRDVLNDGCSVADQCQP
jgi:hypothetical protein